MQRIYSLVVWLALYLVMAAPVQAISPSAVSIQGRLTDSAGTPLAGTFSVQFTVYEDSTGPGFIHQETLLINTDSQGLFSTMLGADSVLGFVAILDTTSYLGIKVGGDPELSPRIRLTSAIWAQQVQSINYTSGGTVSGYINLLASLTVWDGVSAHVSTGGIVVHSIVDATEPTQHYAFLGRADNSTGLNVGVYGEAHDANGSSNSAGIYGRSIGDFGGVIWAGYFDGWTSVNGNFYASSKFFRIDDPTDPANATFEHACVESNEYKNVYDGVVTLDAAGTSDVALPGWFEALNHNFRYQLTAVGAPAPNLYIAQEITNGQFRIAGGAPHGKVSWMVTGVRKDPYALAHPVEVQKAKPEGMRGKYLNPVEYGVGEELGVDYAAREFTTKTLKSAPKQPKPESAADGE